MGRRAFLRRGAGALGGLGLAGSGLLEACHTSKSTYHSAASAPAATASPAAAQQLTTPQGTLGVLNFVGAWLPDVQTAGEYIAESKGFWAQQGFSAVNVIPSGPGAATPQEMMVETGRGLVAVTSLDTAAAAIQKGFSITVIGAQYQKNPACVMSPASKPLSAPTDMIGKRIGVQSVNSAVWSAFLKANNIDASQLTAVTVGFDPSPLAQGAVDGWFAFVTIEPIALQLDKGFATTTFLLSDFNYQEAGNVYICTTASLKTARDKLRAAMTGDVLGWKEALANPTEAVTLALVKAHGLSDRHELLQANAQAKLMVTRNVMQEGLFYVDAPSQAANITTLARRGIVVTASQLFDMSLLDELYQDQNLRAVPSPAAP